MSAIETLSDRELLDRYNMRRSAFRSYARSDGQRLHDERYAREACEAECNALAHEWQRRYGRET
ncbi:MULTISPECIES: hypothetical protein [unclassified Burkholderia]|uniref:hypothetical protein n=1 Tax=unclassified Burkholderia TaxID=2613784 RepID=UPI000F58D28C|nr:MULTISPECIES: hypothetical protein [unclassified Burkholderia]